ncbi:MAG: 30S ribosomal protein S5 [Candidatus Paceibacterota bacterium]|jgi:small subunit ribosomal protein S5|nr:30S ribosomal protein S5 [Candidatus Paceibacterota bacterium]
MDQKTTHSQGAKRPGPWTKGPGQRPGGGAGARPPRSGDGRPGGRSGGRDQGRRPGGKHAPEFGQKIIDIRRVARVVAGGRRFSFSVVVVIGDKKGKVGVGTGKASDTALAIEKAITSAKKNMILVRRTKEGSIPHEVSAKYSSARVTIMPAKGRGLVAGSSVRSVLDLAGVTNITAKLRSGTKNKLNNAQAAILALSTLAMPKDHVVEEPKLEEPKTESEVKE